MSLKSERHVKDASACLSKALTGPDFNLEKVEASIEELPKIDTVLDASLESLSRMAHDIALLSTAVASSKAQGEKSSGTAD